MKKLILILLLSSCGLLYAETKTYYTGDNISFRLDKPLKLNQGQFHNYKLISIIPNDNFFVVNFKDLNDNITLEYYVKENTVFYICEEEIDSNTWSFIYSFYKANVVKISPNTFTLELSEIK